LLKSFKQPKILMYLARPNIDKEKVSKVSVSIAARNEEKYISKCLNSLLQQDYPNFEIIVIERQNVTSKNR
jgi:chlorobactene glucosyltransferase